MSEQEKKRQELLTKHKIVAGTIGDFSGTPDDDDDDDDLGGQNGVGGTSVPGNPYGIPNAALPGGGSTPPGQNDTPDVLINYNKLAKDGKFDEALFRDNQITQTLGILINKKKPNALLVGDAGVGKTQIVEEIARRIEEKNSIASKVLKDATIYELPISHLVSGKSFVGQLEEALKEIVDFASDPDNNAILFIDEAHTLMNSNDSVSEKISQAIKPALARGAIRVIMATTTTEARTFMQDPAFNRRMNTVSVPELTVDQTYEVLLKVKPSMQTFHKTVVISDDMLREIIKMGDEYHQYGSHRPDSAITLLDRTLADGRIKWADMEIKAVTDKILKQQMMQTTKLIISKDDIKKSALRLLTGDDSSNHDQIKKLEHNLENYIIGQKEASASLLKMVKRQQLKLVKQKKPRSFLFAGSTGTGKTEIGKQLADALFGSKDNMIYINMSEYSNEMSLSRITGSSEGYVGSTSKREMPFDPLETNPYQVVLLDEFEKADKTVQRFFMQALDEGSVQTNRGKDIDFSRTIVIATTNAGSAQANEKTMGFGQQGVPKGANASQSEVINSLKEAFDIELINRFEHIVGFTSLNIHEYKQILAIKYNKIIEQAIENRPDKGFKPEHIDLEDAGNYDFINELAEKSYSTELNGRPAEKTMQEYIEDTIIENDNQYVFTFN